MQCWPAKPFTGVFLIACAVLGCNGFDRELHYLGDSELQYYKNTTTKIDYPVLEEQRESPSTFSEKPRTVLDQKKDEVWDLKLAEVLHFALANADIIRTRIVRRGKFSALGTNSAVLSNPDRTASVYDSAIQESGVLFSGRGVEAALAAFDTQFATSMIWGRNETAQNNLFFGGGLGAGSTLTAETANFTAELRKQFAHGGQIALTHNWDYFGSNLPAQLFSSSYVGFVQAQYRQPLLAGAGTEFTRIAGPIALGFRGLTGVNQGVIIARINNDITLTDFEVSVRKLLKDVEDVYWDLYLSYRKYDTAVKTRNSGLHTWRDAKAKLDVGGFGNFTPADEAQARDQYFQARAVAQSALAELYSNEAELRRLMGLPINDGHIVRPTDEPVTAQFIPDWHTCLAEALTDRVELRRQKWQIKSLELQLKAAHSLIRPRLDFVTGYQVNALGDQLFASNDNDGVTMEGFRSGYGALLQGNQTGWSLGFEFALPLGLRSAHAQVRNLELRLTKARKVLTAQKMDISHELGDAFQALAEQYVTAQSNFERSRAAAERVQNFAFALEGGGKTYDDLLRAQASLAQSEVAYYTSLIGYNQAINFVHFTKGTLLERNNVYLSEGEWTPEAYVHSMRRAWARSHAMDVSHLHTEPEEFVTGVTDTSCHQDPHEPTLEEMATLNKKEPKGCW